MLERVTFCAFMRLTSLIEKKKALKIKVYKRRVIIINFVKNY